MIPFAAVLLAGGRSRRMGRDKALLPLADGRPLWQRQLAVLQALRPAELFISGPARAGFPPDVPLLVDESPGAGPLGGIAAALTRARSPLTVVLAIDMPAMTAEFLGDLLRDCGGSGVVPLHPDTGLYEPLAAVYPARCAALAIAQLATADRSLQTFVRSAGSMVQPRNIPPAERTLFTNWNEPNP